LRSLYHRLAILFFLTLFAVPLSAQTLIDKVTNAFEFELHSKHRDSTHYTTQLVLAPVISYEPTTSLGFGIGSKILFKPKKAGDETRTSNIPISLLYTLKNQFIFASSYDISFRKKSGC